MWMHLPSFCRQYFGRNSTWKLLIRKILRFGWTTRHFLYKQSTPSVLRTPLVDSTFAVLCSSLMEFVRMNSNRHWIRLLHHVTSQDESKAARRFITRLWKMLELYFIWIKVHYLVQLLLSLLIFFHLLNKPFVECLIFNSVLAGLELFIKWCRSNHCVY